MIVTPLGYDWFTFTKCIYVNQTTSIANKTSLKLRSGKLNPVNWTHIWNFTQNIVLKSKQRKMFQTHTFHVTETTFSIVQFNCFVFWKFVSRINSIDNFKLHLFHFRWDQVWIEFSSSLFSSILKLLGIFCLLIELGKFQYNRWHLNYLYKVKD